MSIVLNVREGGGVKDRIAILVDDIADTCGTFFHAAEKYV